MFQQSSIFSIFFALLLVASFVAGAPSSPYLTHPRYPLTNKHGREYTQDINDVTDAYLKHKTSWHNTRPRICSSYFTAKFRDFHGESELSAVDFTTFWTFVEDAEYQFDSVESRGGNTWYILHVLAAYDFGDFGHFAIQEEWWFSSVGQLDYIIHNCAECSHGELNELLKKLFRSRDNMVSDSNRRESSAHAQPQPHLPATDPSAPFAIEIIRWWAFSYPLVMLLVLVYGLVSIAIVTKYAIARVWQTVQKSQ